MRQNGFVFLPCSLSGARGAGLAPAPCWTAGPRSDASRAACAAAGRRSIGGAGWRTSSGVARSASAASWVFVPAVRFCFWWRSSEPVRTNIKTCVAIIVFLAEILKDLHIDLADQEFKQLALKYDMQESGQVSYPDFLRHFVLFLRPQPKQAFEQPKLPTINMQVLRHHSANIHTRVFLNLKYSIFYKETR